MTAKFSRLLPLIAAIGAALGVAGTATAQSHGGGHFSGGGSHAAAGGHSSGHAAFAGHVGGFSGGARGFVGAQHFTPVTHAGFRGGAAGYTHAGYYHGGGYYAGHSYGAHWGGGYWGGGYWPRAWYGPGFAWFLPVLPLAYATYWWGGVPYYYANDVYYTWNPSYDGYVATDPPPATADASGSGAIDADGRPTDPGQAPQGQVAAASIGGQVFMYPRNGQSEAQQATDRAECQRWAGSQAAGANSPDDYRRAMTACAEARGYSVR